MINFTDKKNLKQLTPVSVLIWGGFSFEGEIMWLRWECLRLMWWWVATLSWLGLLRLRPFSQRGNSEELSCRRNSVCAHRTQNLLVEPRPWLKQTEGGFAEFGGLVARDAQTLWTASSSRVLPWWTAGALTWLFLHSLVWGRLYASLVHYLPQSVDRGAINRPLGDAHLAQVGTGVARQAFTVLKIFPTELTANISCRLCFMRHGCGKTERKGYHMHLFQSNKEIVGVIY